MAYSADMFYYGSDLSTVFITGIRGCMGMVYLGAGSVFAIHIPPDSATVVKQAVDVFAQYIKNNGQHSSKGRLLGFVNGRERSYKSDTTLDAETELLRLKKKINSPRTTLYRIDKHLGANSGNLGADSVAIQVERTHQSALAPDGYLAYYKRNDDITWIAGGAAPAGTYKAQANAQFSGAKVPSDVNAGWRHATADNCRIASL